MPSGMIGRSSGDTSVESMLRTIAEACGKPEEFNEKYGANYENEVFSMHQYCWCEKDTCEYCRDVHNTGKTKANFIYKPFDFQVWWYKYIGRDTECNKEIDTEGTEVIVWNCLESLK